MEHPINIAQSLMAQGTAFPLRKPPGFHYDFFLLGVTTFIAGLLGLPAPNGLIPQAPIHTTSLLVMGYPEKKSIDEEQDDSGGSTRRMHEKRRSADQNESDLQPVRTRHSFLDPELEPDPTQVRDGEGDARKHEVAVAVVEQRVSNLAQGTLCLVLLTRPFLHVLHLIPRGVLAGLL